MNSTRLIALLAFATVILVLGLLSDSVASETDPSLPVAETPYVLGDPIEAYVEFMMSGGPPPDGIPAIDNPRFIRADEAGLRPEAMVIGFAHGGEAKAYPQSILVHHEIVNDVVGGLNVGVTYCPLTATAQGFERGETTFGVSGQLLNSNLVLFDRETESYFSQINATGLSGEHRGHTLAEVNLIWTTWERWHAAHPDTRVLSDRTGHLRNYDRDPYGSYTPLRGYYVEDRTMFPVMHRSGSQHQKEMVVGARTADASARFVLGDLESERIQMTENFLAVYDPTFHTGVIYERPDGVELDGLRVLPGGDYEFNGEIHPPRELPFEPLVSVDAFYFAWHAFYPDSEHPRVP
ncbi:MAG: DUF3179 domain-containing protein [Gemmatimonadales bacterium]|nr:MAG: DUF3179 domain-containing protein [Gemmatimonadales bacterium]